MVVFDLAKTIRTQGMGIRKLAQQALPTEPCPPQRLLVSLSSQCRLTMEHVHPGTDDDGNAEPGDGIGEFVEDDQAEDGCSDDLDILKGSEDADRGELVSIGDQQVVGGCDQAEDAEQQLFLWLRPGRVEDGDVAGATEC